MMRIRRQTLEYPLGTLKVWMGAPFHHPNAQASEHRNEPACARLQLQTSIEPGGQECVGHDNDGLNPRWLRAELAALHRGSRTCSIS